MYTCTHVYTCVYMVLLCETLITREYMFNHSNRELPVAYGLLCLQYELRNCLTSPVRQWSCHGNKLWHSITVEITTVHACILAGARERGEGRESKGGGRESGGEGRARKRVRNRKGKKQRERDGEERETHVLYILHMYMYCTYCTWLNK